jgi:CMP-N-acetylneuraminic acid synthetase
MKLVALLPMKANSERIKGKNFKNLGGKPLFRWVLDKLLAVDEVDLVVINTDARDILIKNGLVESSKILIRDRKNEICGDHISMNLVIEDDVKNIDADLYLMTHTTNPFLSKNSIEKGISQLTAAVKNESADSLFTVNKVQERFYTKEASPINHDPDNLIRTQDLDPWYSENSNLYIFNKKSFLTTNARIGLNPIMLETPPYESIDIDNPEDWNLAEVMIEYYKKKGVKV